MPSDKSLLMVTASGRDRPGITAAFSRIMLEHGVEVLDVEQASLADLLGLYFLLDLGPAGARQDSFIKDLLYEASRLDLRLDFKLCAPGQCHPPHGGQLLVLTFFGGTRALAQLSEILGQEAVNIERITSRRQGGQTALELVLNVAAAPSPGQLKKRLMQASREGGIDLALQNHAAFRKNKRLVFFDMDSTLVDMEIIDEMARRAGVGREVARITEKAMRGDFDFEQSLIQRVALLKGLKVEELADIRDHLPLSPGVAELTAALKRLGLKLGVVTGGFDFFADHLKESLGLDYAFANRLEIKDGALSGRVLGQVIDAVGKAQIVNQTACEQGILLDQVVVVGDGANDALMLGQAGLGIAYNAKRALDKVANVALGRHSLARLFHLLGLADEDVLEAPACQTG
ncbi:MAG: phosphoserine phosphatase SerB [Desulfarculus sp.]|nr:phosphoserine phosphatase SerB [Desulfarculus sp.]